MPLLQPSACLRGGGRVTAGAGREFPFRGRAGLWVGVLWGAVTLLVPPGTGSRDREHGQASAASAHLVLGHQVLLGQGERGCC